MSLATLLEAAGKLILSPLVTQLEFLGTKIRAHLSNGYILYVWYNATLQKYSYTVIKQDKRVIGWDNAPHHKHLASYPHHFHTQDGKIAPSNMKGNPTEDVTTILRETKKILKL